MITVETGYSTPAIPDPPAAAGQPQAQDGVAVWPLTPRTGFTRAASHFAQAVTRIKSDFCYESDDRPSNDMVPKEPRVCNITTHPNGAVHTANVHEWLLREVLPSQTLSNACVPDTTSGQAYWENSAHRHKICVVYAQYLAATGEASEVCM